MTLNGTQQTHSDRLKKIIDIALDATDEMEAYTKADAWRRNLAFSHCMDDLLERHRTGRIQLD